MKALTLEVDVTTFVRLEKMAGSKNVAEFVSLFFEKAGCPNLKNLPVRVVLTSPRKHAAAKEA